MYCKYAGLPLQLKKEQIVKWVQESYFLGELSKEALYVINLLLYNFTLKTQVKATFFKKVTKHVSYIFFILFIYGMNGTLSHWLFYLRYSYLNTDLPDIFLILITFKLSMHAKINTKHNHTMVSISLKGKAYFRQGLAQGLK